MCFQKCVLKMSGESDLNVGEMTCVDRCVSKYMEAQDKVCCQRNWRRVLHSVCERLEAILYERDIWSRVLAIVHIRRGWRKEQRNKQGIRCFVWVELALEPL